MRIGIALLGVGLTAAAVGLLLVAPPAQGQKGERKARVPPPAAPQVVIPAEHDWRPPADAVILFDGGSTAGWTRPEGSPTGCISEGGEFVCRTGAGDAVSVEKFRDAQIHIEFKVPYMPEQRDQLRGNSGVFVQGCFEMQILDSWENPTYSDGSCGALYGFFPPLVNASRRPNEWQTYDILYRAPRCSGDGEIARPGRVTAYHNGVLIHDDAPLGRRGAGCGHPNICEPGPLRLQDHSGFPGAPNTEMRFRNIWFRRLTPPEQFSGPAPRR